VAVVAPLVFARELFDPALLLRAAHRYQAVTDWHLREPAVVAQSSSIAAE